MVLFTAGAAQSNDFYDLKQLLNTHALCTKKAGWLVYDV